jgi:hypothetical protein
MAKIRCDIEIEVYCDKCKNVLDAIIRRDDEVYVDPCETCLKESYNEGFKDGEPKEG